MSDLERYMDGFDEGLIVLDGGRRLTYVNAAAATMLGRDVQTLRMKTAD